ncbi:putative magnesium transporter NIPA2, partial [Cucurbita argyrosperma subsp. sororia]
MGILTDNVRGFLLAVSSSVFIGSSTIIKKKGLIKSAAAGTRAASGGFSYLCEPWWWAGMITLIVGETANFVAYAYAPAILVTPLGALSIIFSAVLAHFMLKEKLHIFGVLGCILCVVGSTTIVLHAPLDRKIESVKEVMSVKAVAIAVKLTFGGVNQFNFMKLVEMARSDSELTLNLALDAFNSAVISPVYYVTFTTFTIIASMIMFKNWDSQSAAQIATEVCGFITILSGTFLLHKTKDMGKPPTSEPPLIQTQTLSHPHQNLNSS